MDGVTRPIVRIGELEFEEPRDGDVVVWLTRGYAALVSAKHEALVREHKWQASVKCEGLAYAKTTVRGEGGKRTTLYMHRLITKPPKPWIEVDHGNTNGCDNRDWNLRTALPGQNKYNRKWRTGVSGFRGVRMVRPGRFEASIKYQGEVIRLGCYDQAEIAAMAYDAALIELAGPFAMTNAKTVNLGSRGLGFASVEQRRAMEGGDFKLAQRTACANVKG